MIRDNITKEIKELHHRFWITSTIGKDEYRSEIDRLRFKYIIDYDRED